MCRHTENTLTLLSRRMEYLHYCKTHPHFAWLREERWKMDDYECVMCPAKAQTIHHRRYPKVFGTETVRDVVSICWPCHKLYHFPPSLQELKAQPIKGRCPLCERLVTKLNPHVMCRAKVAVLKHFQHMNDTLGLDWIKTANGSKDFFDSKGTRYESIKESRVHAQRLGWFNLLDHKPGRKTGGFRINDNGRRFLEGTLKIPAKIWCRDGEVVKVDDALIAIGDVAGVSLGMNYWDMYGNLQKHKHEV